MEVLEINEIYEWAQQHGLECGEAFDVRLPDWPLLHRDTFSGRPHSDLNESAVDFVRRLGSWDECLVWVRSWGVWPSTEDWPRFYAWRGSHRERRSLETAPGHRFEPADLQALTELVNLILENAWDADVLCARGGRLTALRGAISHHEVWAVFGSIRPDETC